VKSPTITTIQKRLGLLMAELRLDSISTTGKTLCEFLGDVYEGIAKPYRLTISLNPSEKTPVALAVVDAKDRNIHASDVHYPHFIYPCASQ